MTFTVRTLSSALLCASLLLTHAAQFAAEEAPDDSEARMLVKGLIVEATLQQVIGTFNTHGRPQIRDKFAIEFDNLPQKMLKLIPAEKGGSPYIAFSAPLVIERIKRSGKIEPPRRAVIHLSASDAQGKFLIQIIAESLERGSKVRIFLYQEGGFVGSMAEADGVLK
jgi:hypothetical protein